MTVRSIMPMGASINILPAQKVLREVERAARDLRPWFTSYLDPEVTRFYEQQFRTEGRFGGIPWAPLASLTIKLRRRRGHGFGAILRDTDDMYRKFTHSGGLGLRVIKKNEYRRGVVDDKAWRHQEGWTSRTIFGVPRITPVQVPARVIVPDPMPEHIVGKWEKSLAKFIERGKP